MTLLSARTNTNTVGFQVFMDVVKRANFLQVQLDQVQAKLLEYQQEDEAIARVMQIDEPEAEVLFDEARHYAEAGQTDVAARLILQGLNQERMLQEL